jgi:hypothetical protein
LVVHFLIDAMQAGPMHTQGLFKLSILICMIVFLFLVAFVNGAYLLLLASQIKLDTHLIESVGCRAAVCCGGSCAYRASARARCSRSSVISPARLPRGAMPRGAAADARAEAVPHTNSAAARMSAQATSTAPPQPAWLCLHGDTSPELDYRHHAIVTG